MEVPLKMFSNTCQKLQADQFINFIVNNISEKVVKIHPLEYGPLLFVSKKNENDLFTICGPIFNMIKEFAKISNTNLLIYPQPESVDDMAEIIATDDIGFVLVPSKTSDYLKYIEDMKMLMVTYHHSDCIDYFEMGTFISKINYCSKPLLQFLQAFELDVWSLIFISIIIMALFPVISKLSLIVVLENIWNYFILLFSKSIQNSIKKFNNKLIFGTWLISGFYLAICFTSYMLDQMVKAPPPMKLNNLEQLSRRKDMNIIAEMHSTMVAYSESAETELFGKLKERIELYGFVEWPEVVLTLGARLRNGSVAYAEHRLAIIYYLLEIIQNENLGENEPKLTDLLHISEESGGLEPYFIFINDLSPQWVSDRLNFVIMAVRESGLYSKWILDVLEFHRDQIGSIDKKIKFPVFDFETFELSNIMDIVYISILICILSFLTLILEFILNLLY